MRRSNAKSQAPAFTLIEILVVIAIIALLIGLLLSAIGRFRSKPAELATKHEMGQMGNAIENFKSTYDVKYLPSVFILAYNYNSSPDPALADSRRYYSKLWPKAFLPVGVAPDNAPGPGYTRTPPGTQVTFDGNQSLLFFLGGISPPTYDATNNPNGFTTAWQGNRSGFLNSPTNPFNRNPAGTQCFPPVDGTKAKGPFYDFDIRRIDANGHYHDPHWIEREDPGFVRNIYYYFSSKEGNDYNYFGAYSTLIPNIQSTGGYGGVNPFVGPDGKYINPASYQIISAGADQTAGPGGPYVGGQGAYQPGQVGADDQANFANRLLGAVD